MIYTTGGVFNDLSINVLTYAESKDLITSTYLPTNSKIGVTLTSVTGDHYEGCTYNNILFTAEGSDADQTWSGESSIPLSKTEGSCYGYYPYSAEVTDLTAIPVTTSEQVDYLYATPVIVNIYNNVATLTMKHALGAVRFQLKKGTYAGIGQISAVSVTSEGLGTSAKLNAMTGKLSQINGTGSSITVTKSLTLSETEQTVDVIGIPTGTTANLTLSVTIDGTAYSTVVDAATVTQGNCNTYTLTINSGTLSLSGIKIGSWTYTQSGNPTLTVGGHTITFDGDFEDLLFQNSIVSDTEITITTCSKSGKKVRPVTASSGTLTQTWEHPFSVLTLTGIVEDVSLTFNGILAQENRVERFSTAGTYTWIVPEYVTSVDVFLVGGGGGGGCSMHAGGGGGGGGQIVQSTVSVTPGESITLTVGEGGLSGYQYAAYVAYNGEAGGASSFATIVANGGDGGKSAYDSYSGRAGSGGQNYAKGGTGGQPSRFGTTYPTSGEEGVEFDGEIYGSGGGAGGYNEGSSCASTNGGTNAGVGYTMSQSEDFSPTFAKDGYGGGGGAVYGGTQFKNGGDGTVILKYIYYY